MKSIKYLIQRSIPVSSPDGSTVHVQNFMGKELQCEDRALESAIEIAKREAYNGEYTIEDDGEPEPELTPTTEQRVSYLEEQLAQSDETAIALYEAQEAQEVINSQQDEALMEIYEMIG